MTDELPPIGSTFSVDKVPTDFDCTGTISRITDDEIVLRTSSGLWIARRENILDAEVVE